MNPDSSNQPAKTAAAQPKSADPKSAPDKKPNKKSKKGLIISIISGAVVLIGLITWFLVFNLVYNKPDNVVRDAFMKALTAESGTVNGEVSFRANGDSVKIDFSGATNKAGETMSDMTMKFDIADLNQSITVRSAGNKDKSFIKIEDLRSLLNEISGPYNTESEEFKTYFDGLVNKVDGKWVVITNDDIKEMEKMSGQPMTDDEIECLEKQMDQLNENNSANKELAKMYSKNQFFKVAAKGSDKDGNRYELTGDRAKLISFLRAFKHSDYVLAFEGCYEVDFAAIVDTLIEDLVNSEPSDEVDVKFEVWVDGWSHNLNRIAVNGAGDGAEISIDFRTKFNNNPLVTLPKAETTFNDLKSEIEKLMNQFQSGSMNSGELDVNNSL